jgi:hypothetical protein
MDKNDLLTLVSTELPDNNTGDIEPTNLRVVLSQMISSDLNLDELTTQTALGDVVPFVMDAPDDSNVYVRINGNWVESGAFVATSDSSFTVSGSASLPSFLPIETVVKAKGFELYDGPTGAIRNTSGRTIGTMSGTISLNPSATGNSLILVSERSSDGISWTGNLNSIRKVNVSAESFQTKLSLATDWADGEIIRFRMYETGGGSVTFSPTSETILGQSFTGPSLAWDLSES